MFNIIYGVNRNLALLLKKLAYTSKKVKVFYVMLLLIFKINIQYPSLVYLTVDVYLKTYAQYFKNLVI